MPWWAIVWLTVVTVIALYAAIGYIDHINRDPITRKRVPWDG